MSLKIDSHQHFWQLNDPWFEWPTPDLDSIHRDVGPGDLAPHLSAAGVSRTVLVQVTSTLAETRHLLDLASRTDFVAGVVGWVDLERNTAADLEQLATHEKFVGIRPMIQAIPDVEWMLRPELASGLATVQQHDLTFDALVRPIHLHALQRFVDRYPNLRLVVDHGAKPDIAAGRDGFAAWAGDIAAIAERPQVRCKLSGLLTEAGERTSAGDLAPFVDHLLAVFGPGRLMWGSDWPVVEQVASYNEWLSLALSLVGPLSATEQDLIFGGVASDFYRL